MYSLGSIKSLYMYSVLEKYFSFSYIILHVYAQQFNDSHIGKQKTFAYKSFIGFREGQFLNICPHTCMV